jgi:Nitrate/nitrite transporter
MRKIKGSYFTYLSTYFFFFFAMSVFSSVLSVYLNKIGKTPVEISFIVSSSSIFSFFITPLFGYLNDKLKRTKLLFVILTSSAGVAALFYAMTRNTISMFLLNGLIMSSISCLSPLCEKVAGSNKYRYGSVRIWGTFGYAIAAQCSGFIIDSVSPFFLFLTFFIASILAGAAFFMTGYVEPTIEPRAADETAAEKKNVSVILKPAFLAYLCLTFVFSGMSGTNMNFIPLMLEERGISPTIIGGIIAVSTLTELFILFFSHKFMDKFNGRTLLFAVFASFSLQCLCYAFIPSTPIVIFVIILMKANVSTVYMMVNLKVIRNIIPQEYTATALGIVGSAMSLGGICIQNFSGFIATQYNISALYFMLAILSVAGFAITFFLKMGNNVVVFNQK